MTAAWSGVINNVGGSASGLLGATTLVRAAGHKTSVTATLKSADGSRAIQFSTDGGTEYFTPDIAVTSASMLVAAAAVPITHVKFTGLATDTWVVE